MPGITWNLCCSPCPNGARRTTTAYGVPLSSMAKSSPQSVLVRFQESLHRGNFTPVEFCIKDPQKPPHGPGTAFHGDLLQSVLPHDYTFLKSEDTAFTNNIHHRTQPLQYAFTQISPHLHPCNLNGTPALQGLHTFKMVSHTLSLYISQ